MTATAPQPLRPADACALCPRKTHTTSGWARIAIASHASCDATKKELPQCLQEVRHPLEAISIAHPPHNGAHEHLHRADSGLSIRALLLAPRLVQPERSAELVLRGGPRVVDLVAALCKTEFLGP